MNIDPHLESLAAIALGFGQGCGLCFFVGAGGYYSDVFEEPSFFVKLCAVFYLPPVIITIVSVLFDSMFDARLGPRTTMRFRFYLAGCVTVFALFLLADQSSVALKAGGPGIVFAIAAVLGIMVAVLFSCISAMFGARDPRMVPQIVVAQTAAGVYTNIIAHLVGFRPGCSNAAARSYWIVAGMTLLLSIAIFFCFYKQGHLDCIFAHHEVIVSSPEKEVAPCMIAPSMSILPSSEEVLPLNLPPERVSKPSSVSGLRFPMVCWSMAGCQSIAIAMNMSLTPMAYQVAHESFDLTQKVVLTKLLADFVGRLLFFFLAPKPVVGQSGLSLRTVNGQQLVLWAMECLRVPLWIALYLWSQHVISPFNSYMSYDSILLWVVWLPFISLGSLSSSWCFVVAVTAASESQKVTVNRLMAASIYLGFASGIILALVSPA